MNEHDEFRASDANLLPGEKADMTSRGAVPHCQGDARCKCMCEGCAGRDARRHSPYRKDGAQAGRGR